MKTKEVAAFALACITVVLIVAAFCLTSCKPVEHLTVTTVTKVSYRVTDVEGTLHKGKQRSVTIENRLKSDSTEVKTTKF